jgi:hypothetical protein
LPTCPILEQNIRHIQSDGGTPGIGHPKHNDLVRSHPSRFWEVPRGGGKANAYMRPGNSPGQCQPDCEKQENKQGAACQDFVSFGHNQTTPCQREAHWSGAAASAAIIATGLNRLLPVQCSGMFGAVSVTASGLAS